MSLDNPSTVTCRECDEAPLTQDAGAQRLCGRHAQLPGIFTAEIQHRGPFLCFGTYGRRPLHGVDDHKLVAQLFGHDPAQLDFYEPHLISQVHPLGSDPGGFRTWWHAKRTAVEVLS